MSDWKPTRAEALRRLDAFLPDAGYAYAKLRNFDLGLGRHIHVSTLSPWIRHRLILEEEVVSTVLSRHSRRAADKFVQEVLWRTYWKGWLEMRPSVWTQYCNERDRLIRLLESDKELSTRWGSAVDGTTGIDCFDDWAQELVETGYLHNHARMWFASIWIFTLNLPWELGADFFLRHLLDGDPASNTLSWRWVAGLQTRGKTYLARAGNINRYTGGRFNPTGQLAKSAPPLVGPAAPALLPAPTSVGWDAARPTGLLVTEEDLCPQSLFPDIGRLSSVAGVCLTGYRSPLDTAPLPQAFARGAISDTFDRLSKAGYPLAACFDGKDVSARILHWAKTENISQIVTPYVPVGPTRDIVDALARDLQIQGIQLVMDLRRWDAVAWPHATKGFFQFREKTAALLDQMVAGLRVAA